MENPNQPAPIECFIAVLRRKHIRSKDILCVFKSINDEVKYIFFSDLFSDTSLSEVILHIYIYIRKKD